MPSVTFQAEPAPLSVDLDRAALVIIDMQRDFLATALHRTRSTTGHEVCAIGDGLDLIVSNHTPPATAATFAIP
jgi:nicotinamidase-related amidase